MPDRPLPLDDLVKFEIRLSPLNSGDWHLSVVTRSYWTDVELANFDSKVDTLLVAQDAIDGILAQHERHDAQSDSEAPNPST